MKAAAFTDFTPCPFLIYEENMQKEIQQRLKFS